MFKEEAQWINRCVRHNILNAYDLMICCNMFERVPRKATQP